MSLESQQILLNQEVIAVNQDVLGRQGWCAEQEELLCRVWVRELAPSKWMFTKVNDQPVGSSDRWAVVLENRRTIFEVLNLTFDPKRHLPPSKFDWTYFAVRDIINHKDLGVFEGTFSAEVDESSVATFVVTKTIQNNAKLSSDQTMEKE
jgi:hypothetical protein